MEIKLKRGRQDFELEKEEAPQSFYGHGQTWLRGRMVAKETSGLLYDAVRYKKLPKRCRLFDHDIPKGMIKVKSAIVDSDLMEEAMVLDNLHGCPYIRQMLGEEFTRSIKSGKLVTNLLLENCAGGNLVRAINETAAGDQRGLPEATVRQYTRHILMGLARVHDEGYVYGGLKPDNVLLAPNRDYKESESDESLKYIAKLGDMGLAERVGEIRKEKNLGRGGDFKYMAPETLVGNVKEACSDIWALGCVVIEMIEGYSIWDGMEDNEIEEILYGVEEGRIEGELTFESLSREGTDFLHKCMVRKDKRSSARMLLNHPFVREIKEEDMDDDDTKSALEAVEEALKEVKGASRALEAAKEVLEAAKEVVKAVEGVEEFKEMSRLIVSGDFIPLELLQQEEGAAAAEDMSEDFIPLKLQKEEGATVEEEDSEVIDPSSPTSSNEEVENGDDGYTIIPSFQTAYRRLCSAAN